jgi:hypothetical protein
MGSIFVNAGLAAGVALAAVPVILHLFMRQTPKHIIFPALRLIRERQKQSRKRLRIKNWLLLLCRMALLALMALALARPRIDAKASVGADDVPTALALVFDTSPSMGYKEQDKTRLQEAQERARELLKRVHTTSQVFVIDSSDPIEPPPLSRAAAEKRIGELAIKDVNRPLNPAVGRAFAAVAGSDRPTREVFVLTDLTRAAWQVDRPVEGLEHAQKLKAKGGIATYVLRLAPKELRDVAVIRAEPDSNFVAQDEPVAIKTTVRATGKAAQRIAEFYVDGQKRDQRLITVPKDGELELPPFVTKLGPGMHRVEVRLGGEPDPLEFDDRRFLTLDVQPSMKVLVLSDLIVDAEYVANALDPESIRAGEARPFHVDRLLTSRLERDGFRTPLRDYACIFLLDVETLDPSVWNQLSQYVHQGGGLVVAIGPRASRGKAGYNEGHAAILLPATLGKPRSHRGDAFTFGVADVTHPLFEHHTKDLLANLSNVPIYMTLDVKPAKGSKTLLRYQDNAPALLERIVVGSRPGHVLLWTTPLSRRPLPNDPEAWNDFPLPIVDWAFFYLMNQSVPYLAGTADRRLNVEAGEDVSLPIEPGRKYTGFSLSGPGASKESSLGEPVAGDTLMVEAPATIGQWSVKARTPDGPPRVLGFSINPPEAETRLALLQTKELDNLFGKGQYQLASGAEELKAKVKEQHYGREIFPWVMMLILLLVTIENALANTFYRDRRATVPAAA